MKAKFELLDIEVAREFYDHRYTADYMYDWEKRKKQWILAVIRGLDLPMVGKALDFGCGNGIFTDVLLQELPGWEIFGTDLSDVALANARNRVKGCRFLRLCELRRDDLKFDFLFSHHVLEHVADINKSWNEMNKLMRPHAYMLHICPCGNEGSFEHELCNMIENGIELDTEKRFFFEEEGHLRRLSTEMMKEFGNSYGFKISEELYGNHHYGAIEWITRSRPQTILHMTNSDFAKDAVAARRLKRIRAWLVALMLLRAPANVFSIWRKRPKRAVKHHLAMLTLFPFLPLSGVVELCVRALVEREMRSRARDRAAGEMCLFYAR